MRFTPILVAAFFASSNANAYCFKEAGVFYGISPLLLQSIAEHESRMNPRIVLKNANGSIDVGLMGINSVNFPELKRKGIHPERLTDPCTNVIAGAYLLTKKIMKHGYSWKAVGAYHSETPARLANYSDIIRRRAQKKVVAGG